MPKKMKDSGIEWIGKIPEDWDIIKGKYIYDITTGKLDANAEDIGGIYPFFTCSMEPKKINSYAFDCEALLVAGNGIVGFTQYYKGKFNAYQRTYVLSNFSKIINPKYLKFYVSDLLEEAVTTESYGSVISFIKLDNLKNFYVVFPSIAEQTKIANFLDDKCSKIDKAIELNKKAIEEEKEYKQSYIDNMIEGKNDKLIKLKFIADFNKGLSITKDDLKEEGLAVVSYGQIHSKENDRVSIKDNLIRFVDEDYLKYEHSKVTYGDFIFADTSEDYDGVGNAVYNNKKDMPIYAGYHTIIVRINNNFHNKKYLAYLFNSAKWRKQLRECVTGIKVFSISQKMLKDTFVRIPSSDEQDKIVNRLDKICNEIDQMIEIRQKYIEQLQEYKKSLIYEAVTGKIEV